MIALLGGVRATIFAAVAVIVLALSGIQSLRLDRAQDKIVQMELAKEKADVKALEMEGTLKNAIWYLMQQSLKEKADAKAVHDKLRADVLSGERRLRERFTCPKVPANPGDSPGVVGEERRGLLEEDAAFLISEAHRADLITIERNELADIVRALRKTFNEGR